MAQKPKIPRKRRVCDLLDEQITNALMEGDGFVSNAASSLSCDYGQLKKRVAASDKLRAVRDNELEAFKDLTEGQLRSKIRAGNVPCILFFLKCQAKERGYVERTPLQVNNIDMKGVIAIPQRAGSVEEWQKQNALPADFSVEDG